MSQALRLLAFFLVYHLLSPTLLRSQTHSEIVERARKEGRVAYYTTMNITAANLLIRSFEKKHPYIKVDLFRQGGEVLRTRVLTEAQAGRHYFDVASINVLDVQLLKKKGLLAPYVSPHREGIPAGLRDKEGFWTGNFIILYVVGYNTRMITKGRIPPDWWNLLDPMWKGGKIGLDRDAVVWYAALRQNWGRDKSLEFFKKLSTQQPRYERGNTLRTQMMAAGEFVLAVVHAHKVEEFKSKGAPIDWVTTSNPIPAYGNVAGLSSNAPHPHAARLFLDYLFSKEGQLVVQEGGFISVRMDIPPPTPSLDQRKLVLYYVEPALADYYNDYQREYQELIQ